MFSVPTALQVYSGISTSKTFPTSTGMSNSIPRALTDPIFSADVAITGGVVGSDYILIDANDGVTVLATGQLTSLNHTITAVPVFSTPHDFLLRIRKGLSPIYKQVELTVHHSFAGVSIPISQMIDE